MKRNISREEGQNRESIEKDNLYEVKRYADTAFPVGAYTVTREGIMPEGRGYKDLHWHEELQFTYVVNGELRIRIDGKDYLVKEKEAVFINRNLLHITTDLTEDGKYISLNFPDKILGFFPGSRMEQDYVFPYTRGYMLPAVVLKLLPYHRLGLETYERLGRVYELKDIETPGMEEMRKMAESIREKMPGCKVKIKGELYTGNM